MQQPIRNRRKPKNNFGLELAEFRARTGMNNKEIADAAGVNRNTMQDCTTGRSAGHELIPKVRAFMAAYTANTLPPTTRY